MVEALDSITYEKSIVLRISFNTLFTIIIIYYISFKYNNLFENNEIIINILKYTKSIARLISENNSNTIAMD